MTEGKKSTEALLGNEALLRRVLEREPSLVSRIVIHADFLEALFSKPEVFRGLMRAPLVADDYHFDQLLASLGGDGASLPTKPDKEETRLLHLLNDGEALGKLLREQPELAAAVAANPVFIEQVKVRKPQFYRALLEKGQERFSKDARLAAEIRAERESLHFFDNEGGKNETEGERRERMEREAGEKLLEAVIYDHTDPNVQGNDGGTALMYAAFRGRTEIVRALLEVGANPNLQDNNGGTALMYAAAEGNSDAVRALLERGANPNLQERYDRTALMFAAFRGHTEIVRALLEGGANPNLQDNNGGMALMRADSRSIKEMLVAAERKWHHGGPQPERGR